ncbi:thioredoxin domain-containing protein plp1-like [Acanthaster planci]|uniref:Thioredoxin domain-containing protein plp1-like n=1 Tax=Acanthaster planci TaxID=133434 RepID=A0A8B7XRW7_ACAPL|nr:thioredoxin domain-containing protein plp1-like [Acanthaster planci]
MADVETVSKQQAEDLLDDEALAEEKLFEELENEEVPAHIREARMLELKDQLQQLNDHKLKGYGTYSEITKEKDLLDLTVREKNVIVHFFKSDFKLCTLVDSHLEVLAQKYFGTKFAKVSVDVAKFCVGKFGIKVLPAILVFIDAMYKDRIIGFDELGNDENFTTEMLERRLAKSGVIQLPDVQPQENKTILGYDRRKPDEESDDDDY